MISRPSQRVFSGTFRVFGAEALIIPTGLVTTAFLTRAFGPLNFGHYALAAAFIVWVEWACTSVFSRATVKFISESVEWRPLAAAVLRLYILGGAAVAAMVMVIAAPLAGLLGDPSLAGLIRIFALDIPLFCMAQAGQHILVGTGRYRERAWVGAAHWVARAAFILIFVLSGFSVYGAVAGVMAASLTDVAVGQWFLRVWPLGSPWVFPAGFWGYVAPLFFTSFLMRVFNKLDLFLLQGLGRSAVEAGFYGAAQNLTVVPGILALSFSPILLSALSNSAARGDDASFARLSRNALRLALLLLPFAALAAGAGVEIAVFVFGAPYRAAGPVLSLLVFAAVGSMTMSLAASILISKGHPRLALFITLPVLPLAAWGHWLMIPRYGGVGAAAVTALISLAGAAGLTGAAKAVGGAALPWSTLKRALPLAALALGAGVLWPAGGAMLLMKLFTGSLFLTAGFWLTGEFSLEEKERVRSMARGVFESWNVFTPR